LAPGALGAAVPLLLIAACPLGMVLMGVMGMGMMGGRRDQPNTDGDTDEVRKLRAEVARLREGTRPVTAPRS
jgi:hypothetical protein